VTNKPRERFSSLLVTFVSTALLVGLILATISHTNRARQNVLQAVVVVFLICVAIREVKAGSRENVSASMERDARTPLWPSLLIGAAVWAPMIPLYFIGDDFQHLVWSRAPLFRSVWELTRHGQEGLFLRPVGSASIFLEYRLWGAWPDGYHITNLAIHLAGVAGLFCLCRQLRFGSQVAAIASLIYAVLPIEAEAVAWMGARFDLLSACFAIWAAFFYVHFRQTAKLTAYLAALACFFLALLSKENAYLFPLILLAAEFLLLPQRRLKPLAGFFLLAAGLFSYRWLILGGIGGYSDRTGHPIAFHGGFKIMQGLFIRDPALLLLGYNWSEPHLATTIVLTSLASAVLLSIALFYKPERAMWKKFAFCFSWIILPLLPVHPLLLIKPDLANSRILYFSSAGMAMLLAQLLDGLDPVRLRRIAAALLVSVYGAGTLHNIGAWRWTTGHEERFLSELERIEPSPPPNAQYVFQHMPTTMRGVYFLETGLRDAIRMKLGRGDIDATRGSPSLNRPVIHIQWTGKEDPLIGRGINARSAPVNSPRPPGAPPSGKA
jgi:protein O-mannosyl-transferase